MPPQDKFDRLEKKFSNIVFLRSAKLSYQDYKLYLQQTIDLFKTTHSPKYLIKFNGKDFKKSLKDQKTAETVKDDEMFIVLHPSIDIALRRSIENAVSRAISFRDKILRLINSWAGFHLEAKRVSLELFKGAIRMFDYPDFKKVLEIFDGKNFDQINKLRNDYIHFDSPWFHLKPNKDGTVKRVLVLSNNPENPFKQKPEMTSANLIILLENTYTDMDSIIELLISGIDDSRSGRKRLFN